MKRTLLVFALLLSPGVLASPMISLPKVPSVILFDGAGHVTAIWGQSRICKEFSLMAATLLRNYALLHVTEKQQITFLLTKTFKKNPMLAGFAPGLFRILNRIYSFAPKFEKHFKNKKAPSIFYEFFMTSTYYRCGKAHTIDWIINTPYTEPVLLGPRMES